MNNPYDSGFNAYYEGEDLDANPFQEPSEEYDEWQSGWCNASGEDLE